MQEINGVLSTERKPKIDVKRFAEYNTAVKAKEGPSAQVFVCSQSCGSPVRRQNRRLEILRLMGMKRQNRAGGMKNDGEILGIKKCLCK